MRVAGGSPSFSFVFPMWNEEAMFDSTLAAARAAGELAVRASEIASYEIVLVDDDSTDATGALADAAAVADPLVRVVHHQRNRKLGGSVRSGLDAARGDIVLYTDADLPFDLAVVPDALRLLRTTGADIVSGYRTSRRGEGPRRWAYSLVYNALVRWWLGVRVRDVNFAAKFIRRDVIDAIDLRSEGSFIDAELLARAAAAGFVIEQMPLQYFPRSRGSSTLSSVDVVLTMIREMRALGPEIRSRSRAASSA